MRRILASFVSATRNVHVRAAAFVFTLMVAMVIGAVVDIRAANTGWTWGFTATRIPYGGTSSRGSLTESSSLTYTPGTSTLAAPNATHSGTLEVGGASTLTGAVSAGSTLTAVGLYSTDHITASTAGKGLRVKEGSNAKMGTATLNGSGWVTVTNSSVGATSRIFVTGQTSTGACYVKTRSNGVSFSIYSTDASDSGTAAWMIVEPAP